MSIKPPRVEAIELGNLDFKKYTVFALPVSFVKDKTVIQNQLFKNAIEKNFNLDLKEYLKSWPEFKGKAGELIEIPISKTSFRASRIYLVGVGEERRDDLRKAGIALARKVKRAGEKVATGLVNEIGRAHV